MINQAKYWQQKSLNFSDLCRRVWPAKLTNHSVRTNLEIILSTGNTPKKSGRKNLIIVPLENVSINLKLWDYIKYGLIFNQTKLVFLFALTLDDIQANVSESQMEQFLIHVQYTPTELIRVKHFLIRLDSHSVDPQPLSALLEVKIREIMIHEPSSFLKGGNKLRLICTLYDST